MPLAACRRAQQPIIFPVAPVLRSLHANIHGGGTVMLSVRAPSV
ncbi:MAG: hypothetical protein QNJ63_26565 [Calothrix sp. MO_192.B10]|nr:hypothetical protein [Calothrix sp. MO_192.B10]